MVYFDLFSKFEIMDHTRNDLTLSVIIRLDILV